MISALRISVGNGQSYENVKILTPEEQTSRGVVKVFGPKTFVFECGNRMVMTHSWKVNVVQFHKSRPSTSGAIPFERMVLDDDAIYGPGSIIPKSEHAAVGVSPVFATLFGDLNQPLVFVCGDGLMLVRQTSVASLMSAVAVSPPNHGVVAAWSKG